LQGIEQYGAATAYDTAEELFPGYSRTTFMEWASVARAFPTLVRTKDFPDLYFGHFRAVLAVRERPVEVTGSRAEWLKQAQDQKLSVTAFRLAIANRLEYNQPTVTSTPADTVAEAKPTPPPKPKAKADADYSFPGLSIKHQQDLNAMAELRRITPAKLAVLAVAEFLEAHADEVAAGEAAQAMRRAEADAAKEAAQAIYQARLQEQRAKSEAYQEAVKAHLDRLIPLTEYAQNNEMPPEYYQARRWLNDNQRAPLTKIEEIVGDLVAMMPAVDEPDWARDTVEEKVAV